VNDREYRSTLKFHFAAVAVLGIPAIFKHLLGVPLPNAAVGIATVLLAFAMVVNAGQMLYSNTLSESEIDI
jgi:hypothetical protein